MQDAPTHCPFCNGVLPSLPAPLSTEKLACPRCGEPVPAARWRIDAGAIREGPPPVTPARDIPGSGPTALVVLGVMATMAILGLGFMLWTVKDRRARDGKPMLAPVKFRRPLELDGLGHLPRNSQFVVGLQIAEWLEDKKVGSPLLNDPRPAGLDWVLKQITRTTGMELKDLDHVLVAASLDAKLPQLTLVVKTRRPIDLKKVAQAGPVKSTLHQHEPLYEFSLKPAGEALVWCIDDRTALYVIGLDTPKIEHLKGLSLTARPVEEVLSVPLREALKERLAKYQFAWAVGRLDQLGPVKDLLPLVPLGNAELGAMKGVETFAFGLEPTEGLTLTGEFRLRSPQATANLKSFLEGVKIEGTSQKVAATQPHQEQWVTWQVRGDVAAMRDWLSSFSARKAPGER